jgi:hypothetical protein
MKTKISIILLVLTLAGCRFEKSVKLDLVSGLSSSGNLISCEEVYLTVNDQKIHRNTFTYGEELLLNFNNIEGLKKEDGKVFPGMSVAVVNKSGDTLLLEKDLYASYTEGISISPLILRANITLASPIGSNGDYVLFVKVWDKKDKGTYSAKLAFKVTPSDKIAIESDKISYDEIYLFSKELNKVLTENSVRVNQKVYLLFEGLTGMKEEDGRVYPGLSIKGTDSSGIEVLNYDDLFANYSAEGVSSTDFKTQVSSNFVFSATDLKNPVHCVVSIWDKKSDGRIKASFDLSVE